MENSTSKTPSSLTESKTRYEVELAKWEARRPKNWLGSLFYCFFTPMPDPETERE